MRDLDRLIATRRSVGKVLADPIDRDVVHALLELATSAPNHHLTEPWRFVVVTGERRRRLGDAHAAAFARAYPDATPQAREREAGRLERAPVVVVAVCSSSTDDPVTRREDRDAVAAAVQNLLLAAHARGLGAIWRTGAMTDEPEVRDWLGLGAGDEIVAFVYLGRPAATPPLRARRPVDAVTHWR